MKTKTSALLGKALGWAVATCEGEKYQSRTAWSGIYTEHTAHLYSSDWVQGGPIIERDEFDVYMDYLPCRDWIARKGKVLMHGPTPLIAAMRCYVASRFGDEVEVPGHL
jgi:hypothetical protein